MEVFTQCDLSVISTCGLQEDNSVEIESSSKKKKKKKKKKKYDDPVRVVCDRDADDCKETSQYESCQLADDNESNNSHHTNVQDDRLDPVKNMKKHKKKKQNHDEAFTKCDLPDDITCGQRDNNVQIESSSCEKSTVKKKKKKKKSKMREVLTDSDSSEPTVWATSTPHKTHELQGTSCTDRPICDSILNLHREGSVSALSTEELDSNTCTHNPSKILSVSDIFRESDDSDRLNPHQITNPAQTSEIAAKKKTSSSASNVHNCGECCLV